MFRLTFCLLGLLSISITAIIVLPRLNPSEEYACLQGEDQYTNRTVINLNTGDIYGGANGLINSKSDWRNFRPSPDGKQAAISYTNLKAGNTLALQQTGVFQGQIKVMNDNIQEMDGRDIAWSPDGHWLAYRWRGVTGSQYLTITDYRGRERQSVALPAASNNMVSLHGWSGDGHYLAVSIEDSKAVSKTIQVWAAPNLELVKTVNQSSGISARIFGDPSKTMDTVQWSKQRSWLAFLTANVGQDLMLTLYSPANGQQTSYDVLPMTQSQSVELSWSPNGQYIAVISTPQTNDMLGRIDLFGLDGTKHSKVSDTVLRYVEIGEGGGTGLPLTVWSKDGNSLFFAEQLPSKSYDLGALVAFRVDKGKKIVVHPAVYMNPNTAADNRYLFARFPNDGREDLEQDAANDDSLVVVDTDTFKVLTVDAQNTDLNIMRQVYRAYAPKFGWLVLTEDYLTTWALNMQTGVRRSLPQGFTNFGAQIIGPDTEFIASIKYVDENGTEVYVTSLRDGLTRLIPYSSKERPDAAIVSPDGRLIALATFNGPIDIVRADGSLVRHTNDPRLWSGDLAFTHCG